MGLAPEGQGARAILEGWTEKDGKLPVNPSGGLKAKGHPIGATGASMHVLAAMQLTGTAGGRERRNHLTHQGPKTPSFLWGASRPTLFLVPWCLGGESFLSTRGTIQW